MKKSLVTFISVAVILSQSLITPVMAQSSPMSTGAGNTDVFISLADALTAIQTIINEISQILKSLSTATTNAGNTGKTTICHGTGSETNPFVMITVDNSAISDNGFSCANGDIIPGQCGTVDIVNSTCGASTNTGPTLTFYANKYAAFSGPGDFATLFWQSTNATSCTASNNANFTDWLGTEPISNLSPGVNVSAPAGFVGTVTYKLSCGNATGPSASAKLNVTYQIPPV